MRQKRKQRLSQIRDNGQYNTADAILSAVNQLEAGDVLLLEAQASFDGYGDKYLPVEVQPDILMQFVLVQIRNCNYRGWSKWVE